MSLKPRGSDDGLRRAICQTRISLKKWDSMQNEGPVAGYDMNFRSLDRGIPSELLGPTSGNLSASSLAPVVYDENSEVFDHGRSQT